MKKYFLFTAFGKDRSGIVSGVTKVLFDLGANIEDASMTRLGGEFSMMLVAALPATTSAAKLGKGFQALKRKWGIQVDYKPILASAARRVNEHPAKYLISVYGTDHAGIVYQVTQALAKRQVSVTDLQTKIIGSSSKPVYVMLLEIQVPAALEMDELTTELDQLRQDLKVDITLQDIEAIPL